MQMSGDPTWVPDLLACDAEALLVAIDGKLPKDHPLLHEQTKCAMRTQRKSPNRYFGFAIISKGLSRFLKHAMVHIDCDVIISCSPVTMTWCRLWYVLRACTDNFAILRDKPSRLFAGRRRSSRLLLQHSPRPFHISPLSLLGLIESVQACGLLVIPTSEPFEYSSRVHKSERNCQEEWNRSYRAGCSLILAVSSSAGFDSSSDIPPLSFFQV